MNNTLYDVDFTRSLPGVLKNDETMLALAKIVSDELSKNAELTRRAVIYPRIGELDEDLLDILAYDLHADWYEYDSPLEVKREIVKNSVKVHKRTGTKYAVENVVKAHFGSATVKEWFEYGGEPHGFKIISHNPSVTNDGINRFLSILESVKRKSSHLEAVLITLTGEMSLFTGVVLKSVTKEFHVMGARDCVNTYAGTVIYESSPEAHVMGGREFEAFYGAVFYETAKETHEVKEA